MVIVGKYTIQIDPVGLIKVPKVTAVLLPVLAGSSAVSSRPLRMNSSERTAVFYVVCVRVTPAVTIEEREDDVMMYMF